MHIIRIRGHWKADLTPDGRTRHVRHFGQPRTLDAGESVWLTGTLAVAAEVLLNGQPLGSVAADEAFACEITPWLKARNEVALLTAAPLEVGELQLEIRG